MQNEQVTQVWGLLQRRSCTNHRSAKASMTYITPEPKASSILKKKGKFHWISLTTYFSVTGTD